MQKTRLATLPRFPVTTGQGARIVGTTEPRLAEQVRRGRVHPEPPILAGRRLWQPAQLSQAAAALGLLTGELKALLEAARCEGQAS